MKIAGIIPARYNSVRFPGKALACIDGTPMIIRVCEAALRCGLLSEVHVATDSPEIREICGIHGISVIITENSHRNPTSRVQEASDRIKADLYVMIGGDEPLLTAEDIALVVNEALPAFEKAATSPGTAPLYVVNAMTELSGPDELADPGSIKVICAPDHTGLYLSRLPLPYSGKAADYPHRKFVSIGVYTKEALDFFAETPQSRLEQAEECDLLRFIEHKKTVLFTDIHSHTHSVDTPKDLELVETILQKRRTHEQPDTTL